MPASMVWGATFASSSPATPVAASRPSSCASRQSSANPKGQTLHVVYLDAYDYLNPHEARLPQILMALLVALSEEPRWDLKQTRTAPVLWDRVRKILDSLGREVGKDLTEATGLPLIRSLFRVDLKLARGFRKASEDHIQEILGLTRDRGAQLEPRLAAGARARPAHPDRLAGDASRLVRASS
jgi:hypothetical protein